jgi:steroid delta-isomerase
VTDATHIRAVYDRYLERVSKGDVDGIVELYADDATIEDPVGSELRRGRDAITMRRSGQVHAAGREAATPLVVLLGPEGPDQRALDVISVMRFDDAGKIASMRAFWSFDAMRPATEADR